MFVLILLSISLAKFVCSVTTAPTLLPSSSPTSSPAYNYIFKIAGAANSATVPSGTGGKATAAYLIGPKGLYLDSTGVMYIADETGNCIRYFNSVGNQIVNNFAGVCGASGGSSGVGGKATSALLNEPVGIAGDAIGNVFFADYVNNYIKKVNLAGIISVYAGDGTTNAPVYGGAATSNGLNGIGDCWMSSVGELYLAPTNFNQISKVSSSGIVNLVAGIYQAATYSGDGGPATSASMTSATRVTGLPTGAVYIADSNSFKIRFVSSNGIISTAVGTGSSTYLGENIVGTSMAIGNPLGVGVDRRSGDFYYCDYTNDRVGVLTKSSGKVSTFAGTGTTGYSGDGGIATLGMIAGPRYLTTDTTGKVYFADYLNRFVRVVYSLVPSASPTVLSTVNPSIMPSVIPSQSPTLLPSVIPSLSPTTTIPSVVPTLCPSYLPTITPSMAPTCLPSVRPSVSPSVVPSTGPSQSPSIMPSATPSQSPTRSPSCLPSVVPTLKPSFSFDPTMQPSRTPSLQPSVQPSLSPTVSPTLKQLPLMASPSYLIVNSFAFAGITTSGSVMAWGDSESGGDCSAVSALLVSVTKIVSSKSAFAALTSSGAVVAWGHSTDISGWQSATSGVAFQSLVASEKAFAGVTSEGAVVAFGAGCCGGNVDQYGAWSDLYLNKDVVSVRASSGAFCALKTDGSVYCWGNKFTGGGVSSVSRNDLANLVFVTSTRSAFAGLTSDGSVVVWGSKYFGGQLSTDESAKLEKNTEYIVSSGSAFVAYTSDKSLVAWGTSSATITANVTYVAHSSSAFAALRSNQSVVVWGDDSVGGDASSVVKQLVGVTSIVGNTVGFAAVTSDGAVVSWGGAALIGAASLSNVDSVLASSRAFAALKSDGSVVTWGASSAGGSVDSSFDTYLSSDVKLLCSNELAFTAIRSDGLAVSWGNSKSVPGSGVLVGVYSALQSC